MMSLARVFLRGVTTEVVTHGRAPVVVSTNEWSSERLKEVQSRFPFVEVMGKEKDGLHFLLSSDKAMIHFKGGTPTQAAEDLKEGLNCLGEHKDELSKGRVKALAEFLKKIGVELPKK